MIQVTPRGDAYVMSAIEDQFTLSLRKTLTANYNMNHRTDGSFPKKTVLLQKKRNNQLFNSLSFILFIQMCFITLFYLVFILVLNVQPTVLVFFFHRLSK